MLEKYSQGTKRPRERPEDLVLLADKYETDFKLMRELYKKADEVEEVAVMKVRAVVGWLGLTWVSLCRLGVTWVCPPLPCLALPCLVSSLCSPQSRFLSCFFASSPSTFGLDGFVFIFLCCIDLFRCLFILCVNLKNSALFVGVHFFQGKTAVLFWGQTTWDLTGLFPKRDCSLL